MSLSSRLGGVVKIDGGGGSEGGGWEAKVRTRSRWWWIREGVWIIRRGAWRLFRCLSHFALLNLSSFSRRRLFGSDYPVRKGWEMPPLSVFLSMQLRYRKITPPVPARIAESSPCR
jgi:hypothetical protein